MPLVMVIASAYRETLSISSIGIGINQCIMPLEMSVDRDRHHLVTFRVDQTTHPNLFTEHMPFVFSSYDFHLL